VNAAALADSCAIHVFSWCSSNQTNSKTATEQRNKNSKYEQQTNKPREIQKKAAA
jgi:hypothetical protein